ncbi:MAG: hypothetical protein A2735_03190 [Candidatus Yanofskybacteria bacterium RIFCSPHIGHO2_01_FULL_41_21]|uniref:Uncharacterized protein n=1 Tax=Candidatus Yanofskybacteria bacterium RIFCSPHIGHO2_01_FULL_41_21 TaxID=1802660 RepID=A0A1F8EB39_9BACT|nr:MAG: hypothetical protein A2735_03190 [Candidatus Yanofskybacteria bacterium RIFCSPHIGHO2_01_FULL_41_21]
MKQIFLRFCAVFVLVFGLFSVSLVAHATTPTLSVSATGSGDSVTVSVYGDPNASVTLYQQNQGYNYNTQTQYLGTTNSSGYLSTTVNTNNYGITSGSSVYVVVNNQTSSSVVWPYNYNNYNNYNYGNYYGSLSLSQTNVSVNVGQSVNVTINGGSAPYTMYPTGTNIFQAVIGGNNLQIVGLSNGSGSVNVCSSGGTGSGCVVLSVTVNSSYYGGTNYYNPPVYNNQAITFSQNNPSLYIGQSMTISVSGGNISGYYYGGNYYVGHNSNSSVLSANMSGSTLTLQGLANGNTAVVVCTSSTNCSALNITVGSTGYVNPNNNFGNWISCAGENQYCSFSGTRNVQYGANGVYVYRTFTNGVNCSNAVFGDPIFGVAKRCSISGY